MARYEIEVLPWAIADVREAHLYLLERDKRLADEFQRRVSEALQALADTAHRYQARKDSIRRCALKKPQENRGIVYAVAHSKRGARLWKKR